MTELNLTILEQACDAVLTQWVVQDPSQPATMPTVNWALAHQCKELIGVVRKLAGSGQHIHECRYLRSVGDAPCDCDLGLLRKMFDPPARGSPTCPRDPGLVAGAPYRCPLCHQHHLYDDGTLSPEHHAQNKAAQDDGR